MPLALVFLLMLVPATSGADMGVGGARRTAPSQAPAGRAVTATPPVAPKPFHIDPAVLGEITKVLLNTDTKPAAAELEAALKETEKLLHTVQMDLWYYQDHAKKCSKKTFTTEDQKTAGCTGNDTLNQCTVKLFQYCVGHNQNSPTINFPKSRQKMLEESARLDKALKEYTAKLKLIPEIKEAK
jgi:hypothetical protein